MISTGKHYTFFDSRKKLPKNLVEQKKHRTFASLFKSRGV
jgi:hypothetical protein